nr:uncharacterized protein LOC132766283 [Anolis sagrei ordinatus]
MKAPVKRFRLEPLDSAEPVSKKQRSGDIMSELEDFDQINENMTFLTKCVAELHRMAKELHTRYIHFKEYKKKVEQCFSRANFSALYNEMKGRKMYVLPTPPGQPQISRRLSRRGKGDRKKPTPGGLYWRRHKVVNKARKTLALSKSNRKRKWAPYSRVADPTSYSTSESREREGHSPEPSEGERQPQQVDSPSNEGECHPQQVDSPGNEGKCHPQQVDSPGNEGKCQPQQVDSPSNEGECQPQQVDSPGNEDDGSPPVVVKPVQSWRTTSPKCNSLHIGVAYSFRKSVTQRPYTQIVHSFYAVIQGRLGDLNQRIDPQNCVIVRIQASGLQNPIIFLKRCGNVFNEELFLAQLSRNLQSNMEICAHADFNLIFTIATPRQGGAH